MCKANKPTDIRVIGARLYLLPVQTRVPLKFGAETLTSVTCARVCVTVRDHAGNTARGWGETPLSVQWVWPSDMAYAPREASIIEFTKTLCQTWAQRDDTGHPIELAWRFIEDGLHPLLDTHNAVANTAEPMGQLAALVAFSALDIAAHDAYGRLHGVDIYDTYNADYMNLSLDAMIQPASDSDVSFARQYPADYLVKDPPVKLPAWHLVGGLDALTDADRTGDEPDDGYPVTLEQWIKTDALTSLKIKLRGNDAAWDYDRLVQVGKLGLPAGVEALSADFNCTVTDPQYVNDILDRLAAKHPAINDRLLYVEQPFPHDLSAHRIDVHSVSKRSPLFLDESAHDWTFVRLGRELGWSGVALKTCKTQTGALLSLCWAKAHGMPLMVQDLTNPMLAQIPHCRLAAHAGTIRGIETNAPQFYPAASDPEAKIHPGLYRRKDGCVDLSTLSGPGFGYREDEIQRALPDPAAAFGEK